MEILALWDGKKLCPTEIGRTVLLKSSNLAVLTGPVLERGERVLEGYLGKKGRTILETEGPSERMHETMSELFALPGYCPCRRERVMMSHQLKMVGNVSESVPMLLGYIAEMSPSDQEYGWIHYEFAVGLTLEDKPAAALEAALKIDTQVTCDGGMCSKQLKELKGGVLALVDRKCSFCE